MMKVNKENLSYGLENNQYTVLEKKQMERIIEELNMLTHQIGVESRVEMTVKKDRTSRVSIWASGFLSPVFVSKTEQTLLKALYKVRRMTIRKMRKEAEKLKSYKQNTKLFGTDVVA